MKAVIVPLALLLAPTLAAAGPIVYSGPPGSAPPRPVAPLAQPVSPDAPKKLVGIDRMQQHVSSSRGLIGSTALTVPEGKVEATLQLVVPFAGVAGLNAGITKSTEAWVDGATTFTSDGESSEEHAYGIGIKQVLVRNKNLSFALTGSLRKVTEGFSNSQGWKSLGAVGSVCIDDDCGVMVSASAQQLFGFNDRSYDDYSDESESATMFTLGASVGGRSARVLLDIVSVEEEKLAFIGVRLGGAAMAVDLALIKPIGDYGGNETVPWLGVTARM